MFVRPLRWREIIHHAVQANVRRFFAAVATSREGTDSHEDRPQLSVAVRPLRLRILQRAENISSALKRRANVCQEPLSTKCSGFLLRSSFAILAARTRHRFSSVSIAAFSITSGLSNSSDIVHPQAFGADLRIA